MRYALVYYCNCCKNIGFEIFNLKLDLDDSPYKQINTFLKKLDYRCIHCNNNKNFLENRRVIQAREIVDYIRDEILA